MLLNEGLVPFPPSVHWNRDHRPQPFPRSDPFRNFLEAVLSLLKAVAPTSLLQNQCPLPRREEGPSFPRLFGFQEKQL